jgi:pyrroloquinoline-quinone synthase
MNLEARLQESIGRWNLLDSTFYQAWSAGTLPVEGLRTYAREYGAFISLVPRGWATHGDARIAKEERQHVGLWRQFAKTLHTDIDAPQVATVQALAQTADRLFGDAVTALGALYAFEAQQPATTRSKLDGLRAHYDLPRSAEYYFQVHADDESEPRLLLSRMANLAPADQQRASDACREMCQALRAALDELGVLYAGCATVQ